MALVLLGCQFALQSAQIFPRWRRNYSPAAGGLVAAQLSPDQILLQLFGFREFLAGILWVRADGFFDEGNYDAILPIIRLCTLLDPHEIDIFATGMWHIAYNFTDTDQRSDRRYIPAALALGKEGSAENPETYELFFETGWTWFNKILDDPDQAVKWFQLAQERKDMIEARKNLLATAYIRSGDLDAGLAEYYKLYEEAIVKAHDTKEFGSNQVRDTLEQNLDNTIIRLVQRGSLAEERNDGSYEKGQYDTKPPFNVGFSAKVTVVSPRHLKFEGTYLVQPVGTRIRVVLRDADYPEAKLAELNWDGQSTVNLDPPKNRTYMQDDLFIKNRRFDHDVDMSNDPTMYPMHTKNYLIEFFYDPRYAPPHIQDKFGYKGEGFADSNFLSTDARKGARVLYTSLQISQDQLLRRGEWANVIPVLKTKNYVESSVSTSQDDIIKIPTLRSQ